MKSSCDRDKTKKTRQKKIKNKNTSKNIVLLPRSVASQSVFDLFCFENKREMKKVVVNGAEIRKKKTLEVARFLTQLYRDKISEEIKKVDSGVSKDNDN